MKLGKRKSIFLHSTRGSFAIIFAIILPFIICFIALACDGARILMKKARLADAINEATLVIATRTDPDKKSDPEEQRKNETILLKYINAYLPGTEILEASINSDRIGKDPSSGADVAIFDVKARIRITTVLPLKYFPSFDPEVDISNGGSVRKGAYIPSQGVDFLLLVDFSGSMDEESAAWDEGLVAYLSRITLLKKVVKEIIDVGLETHPDTTFGIIPWETGVPVKLEGKNVLGGDAVACSALMVPKTPQNSNSIINFDIDYNFWEIQSFLTEDPEFDKSWKMGYLDYGRFVFFQNNVIPYLPDGWNNPWCQKYSSARSIRNINKHTNPDHQWDYNCEFPNRINIYSTEGQKIIDRELNDYVQVSEVEGRYRILPNGETSTHGTIFNYEAMNIPKTLENMFTDEYVITVPVEVATYSYSFCSSLSDKDNAGGMATYKAPAYMIELTNNRTKLDDFQAMVPQGGTNSSVGLLRGVPVLSKGKNPRKVMVMITDGDDFSESDKYLTELLHVEYNVCDKIRKGIVEHSPDTEQVDIYFISVKAENEDEERLIFWRTYCTGQDKAFIADNYTDLIYSFKKIMEINEETGYFYSN